MAARAASGRSVLAVWPWASGKGPSRGHPAGAARACEARWAGRVGGRLWGQLGESRGSGQASWPYPPVSCPHPAAQAPLPRGICHLLERKERKSKGSSLCRHLETQLDFLRTVGRGGQWAKGPEEGIQAHEWRRSEQVPTRTVPSWGLSRQGPGVPRGPPGKEAPPAQCVRVCSCESVRVAGGRGSSRGRSVHCRGWDELTVTFPSVAGVGGLQPEGLGFAHSHCGAGRRGAALPVSRHTALLTDVTAPVSHHNLVQGPGGRGRGAAPRPQPLPADSPRQL